MNAVEFKKLVGRDPVNDELDRVNCPKVEYAGHSQCGICDNCGRPRFICEADSTAKNAIADLQLEEKRVVHGGEVIPRFRVVDLQWAVAFERVWPFMQNVQPEELNNLLAGNIQLAVGFIDKFLGDTPQDQTAASALGRKMQDAGEVIINMPFTEIARLRLVGIIERLLKDEVACGRLRCLEDGMWKAQMD